MKKILFTLGVISALLLMPATVPAQNWIRTNGYSDTDFNHGSFLFIHEKYHCSTHTRIKAHLKIHNTNSAAAVRGIFGNQYLSLRIKGSKLYYTLGELHTEQGNKEVELCNIKYDKELWIDFSPTSITIDEIQDATKHQIEVTPAQNNFSVTDDYFLLGACWDNSGLISLSDVTVYDVKLYDGNQTIASFIPARHNNKYGFYDLKNDIFRELHDYKSPTASGHIVSCNEHKYIHPEEKDGQCYAHCYICDETVPINSWKQTEDLGISSVQPFLDVEADSLGIGEQKMILTGTNPIYEVVVLDSLTNELLCSSVPDNPQTAIITLPTTEKKRSLIALARTIKVVTHGTDQDTAIVWTPINFEQKPFHKIHDLGAKEIKKFDKSGNTLQSNAQINFAIQNPKDEDIMPSDQFIIQRAFNDDYSDASVVGSLAFGDDKDGLFTFVDESDYYTENKGHNDSTYCTLSQENLDKLNLDEMYKEVIKSFYTVPDYHVNYRVSRALVTSMWPNHRGDWCQDITVRPTVTLAPVSSIQVEKTRNWSEDKTVKLKVLLKNPYPWEYNELLDSNIVKAELAKLDSSFIYRRYVWDENAKITILRYSPENEYYQGNDYAAKEITINGSDVKWDSKLGCFYAEAEDIQNLPYLHYYYKATSDRAKSIYPMPLANISAQTTKQEADDSYSTTAALIDSLVADQGTTKGQICVRWAVGSGESSNIKLQRRVFNGTEGWKDLQIDYEVASYVDKDIAVGTIYEYRLEASLDYRGSTYVSEATTRGWCSFYGTLAGKVVMPDGTGMANVKVIVTRTTPIYIPDVKDQYGNIVLKGIHEGATADAKEDDGEDIHDYPFEFVDSVRTDANGVFRFDSLLYSSEAAQYTIIAECGVCSFVLNTSNTLTLSGKRCVYEDLEFICTTSNKFVGRVLYENSTVPVKGAGFLINGQPMMGHNGQPVVTDQDGNFSFNVPQTEITIKVYKKGHTFLSEYILDKDGKEKFTPDRDYSGLILYDTTKIRLMGRLSGGNTQGSKPLGFSESINNLGDNLTMVLQLEGNNTAQIVYKKDDPDNTEINDTIAHPWGGATTYSLQKKRIVITPDVKTGEFFVDLFPTKYKITQISAQGYASLFAEGEGFEVIDLTDKIDSLRDTISIRGQQKTVGYYAKYNRIYHNPVTLTYQQYKYGMKVGYLGEENINETNLLGTKFNATIASVDKESGNVNYTFGYPVFVQGNKYTLQVRAHEDYYYNGDTNTRPDEVNLNGGTLHVHNGLNTSIVNEQVYELDSLGMRTIVIDAQNTNFSLKGENALKSLRMQVEVNKLYYDAAPLKGFVFGSRNKGTDALASMDGDIEIVDVIRDPYGATSSAYREAGTTYHWGYNKVESTSNSLKIDGKIGVGGTNHIGFIVSHEVSWSVTANPSINIPLGNTSIDKKSGQYEMKLNERISTSADPLDVGAMADVYVGYESGVDVGLIESLSIIDSTTYSYVTDAVAKGAVKVLASGKDARGQAFYIVIGDKVSFGKTLKRTFAYTQKHIIGTLIPDLKKKRDALLRNGTQEQIQALANETKTNQYMIDGDGYQCIFPTNNDNSGVDLVMQYNNAISNWEGVVARNEKAKLDAIKGNVLVSHYSVAGTAIDHSESVSQYYQDRSYKQDTKVTGGIGGGGGNNGLKNDKPDTTYTSVKALGVVWALSIGYNRNISISESKDYYQVSSMGSGYKMTANDNSYFDIDVYRVVADKAIMIKDKLKDIDKADVETAKIHDYVFYVCGGATRNPWVAPDSTLYYEPGTPLGVQTLKIDNPRLYIDNPVISNLPEDETAFFTLTMTNDTELSGQTSYLNPSKFTLKEEDGSNPNGAKLYIDGEPIGTGRDFVIAPGKSVTKTLEVKRGTGYDYNNIKLRLRDAGKTLSDYATISIHYLPVAPKLTMSAPKDKWVMNTLSAFDDKGYYIPVTVGDFNANSEGFHHIELQYKKQNEGESQYVNLCSFYNDSTLFAEANGEKRMLSGGKIDNFKFYGEKDPIEMKYDLRAVSFRSLGTGFTTRSSNVISGIKDTRCPQIFGLPAPTNSILTYEDLPSLNFTEPIAYNYLDKTSNFQVVGYTNETDIQQSSTLLFSGDENQDAYSSVERNLSNRDFTIDMMVRKSATADGSMTLFSHGDESEFVNFFLSADNRLNAMVAGNLFTSVPLEVNLSSALTHIGMAYNHSTGLVKFFVNNSYIDNAEGEGINIPTEYHANGRVHLGTFYKDKKLMPFSGNMLEVRLWSKVLSDVEISALKGKHLTGYEQQLIANWPLTETYGTLATDRVHGANLILEGLDWDNVEGYSLHVDKAPIELVAKDVAMDKESDYSLQFWFKVDELDESIVTKQNGRSALFKVGDDHLAKGNGRLFIGFEGENVVVNSNDSSMVIGKKSDFVSTGWHHFAMSVNRPLNHFNVYMDSKLTYQSDANTIDGLASDYAALGDSAMVGNFDIFVQWETALPDYYIKDFFNSGFYGTEMGMKNYLPFHYNTSNSQDTRVLVFSANNEVVKYDADGNVSTKKTQLIASPLTDKNKDEVEHAPVKESPMLQNLDFSWSSTGNALQLNINELDSKINKQYVYLTVRGVEDLSGNTMKNPVMWACYVDKNVLEWTEQNVEIVTPCTKSASENIYWKNISGKRLDFKVTNLPTWLTINKALGTVMAEQEGYFTVTTDKDLAPGKYTETIYLEDENGLADPLTINLTVSADESGWSVDKTKYDRTMNLMAKVVIKGHSADNSSPSYDYIDDNPNDKVGAFIMGECVGVANITNDPALGSYLFMTVYGDSLIASSKPAKNITFLLWRHDSGQIYELENILNDGNIAPIVFKTNNTIGLPPAEPITLKVSNKMEQDLYLTEGWNWVSFNVSPRAVDGINSIFINQAGLFSDDDIIKHVDFAQYNEQNRSWMGTLSKTDYKYVYQIFVKNAGTYKLLGYELPQDSLTIKVKSGWNDMPYLLQEAVEINKALSDFQIGDKAKSGDIIKSLDEFAVAKVNADGTGGSWVGTLKYLTPGKGYYLKHNGDSTSFAYQKNVLLNHSKPDFGAKPEASNYEYNMPMIAAFADDVDYQEGDKLAAYVNDVKVGETEMTDGRFFLSINANDGDVVVLAQERGGNVMGKSPRTLKYVSNGVVGSIDSPYRVSFSDDAFDNADIDMYNLKGMKLNGGQQPLRDVYIINGKKTIRDNVKK